MSSVETKRPPSPCPFCDSPQTVRAQYPLREAGVYAAWVECFECRARGPIAYGDAETSSRKAVDSWDGPAAQKLARALPAD